MTLSAYKILPTHNFFDDFFDTLLTPENSRFNRGSTFSPRANIEETSNGYDIHIAAPGLSRDDFKIHTDSGLLTVTAECEKKDSQKWMSREFSYNTFTRSWRLPTNSNTDSISARYDAGVLTVSVPTVRKKSDRMSIKVE